MTDRSDDMEHQGNIIVAFTPSTADYATDGHLWSIYNPTLDSPYDVLWADQKLNEAVEKLDPHDYDLREGERWIRLDWRSVVSGEPERVEQRYDSTDTDQGPTND